jgi:hypothetical protein
VASGLGRSADPPWVQLRVASRLAGRDHWRRAIVNCVDVSVLSIPGAGSRRREARHAAKCGITVVSGALLLWRRVLFCPAERASG